MSKSAQHVQQIFKSFSTNAISEINDFASDAFRTRSARTGSGMGQLIEGLWGYWMNRLLRKANVSPPLEVVWLEHQYNDFACIERNSEWNPDNREGEYLRIEAKSMITAADESKAHFDEIVQELEKDDLLLVLLWEWRKIDDYRVYPHIIDHFLNEAIPVAEMRDRLHVARGCSFVDRQICPDGCDPEECPHHGEPLNENGKRERSDGPEACRVSSSTSYANNFGGLVRMIATRGEDSRKVFHTVRRESDIAHEYISFIHRNFPDKEESTYVKDEWKAVADDIGIGKIPRLKDKMVNKVRETDPNYEVRLRELFPPES